MYKYIMEMVYNKRIGFSEAEASMELASEANADSEDDLPTPSEEPINPEGVEVPEDDTEMNEDKPVDSSEVQPVKRVQTLDILNMVMQKYDAYINDTKVQWEFFIKNGKITNLENYKYIEDLHNLLNKTLDEKENQYLKDFNTLYDSLSDANYMKNLSMYSKEKYGKPFLAEGLVLLLYELAIDWAVFLAYYFKEAPKIESENDSFFNRFPNLLEMSYFAHLFNDSNEFKKLITSDKARELLVDDTKYNLTGEQLKKKPKLYRAKGESLSYYASLVRYDFADIMVGALDKLGKVCFITSKCPTDLIGRMGVISELINTVVKKDIPAQNNATSLSKNEPTPMENMMSLLDKKATDILRERSEARIIFESNMKNYLMVL